MSKPVHSFATLLHRSKPPPSSSILGKTVAKHRHPHPPSPTAMADKSVQQCRELQIAVLTGGFTHAVQPGCPCLIPALCPGRGGLCRVPLGWIHFLLPLRSCFRGPLFADFAGTTDPSDLLLTCVRPLPSETLNQRSVLNPLRRGGSLRMPAANSGSSTWNFGACTCSMTPPCPSSPCQSGEGGVAFPLSGQGRHTGILMSELNGWPASPCTHLSCRSLGER